MTPANRYAGLAWFIKMSIGFCLWLTPLWGFRCQVSFLRKFANGNQPGNCHSKSITISSCLASTFCPSVALTVRTTPPFGALNSLSIFMAAITTSV